MINDAMIKDALMMAYKQEISDIEGSFSTVEPYVFSDSYKKRIKKIARLAK